VHLVLEFSDVARPGVCFEELECFGRESGCGFRFLLCEVFEEVEYQDFDVLGAVAEGGDVEGEDPEAIEEVGSEALGFDFALQVSVGGGHDPDVDASLLPPAEGAHGSFLKDAQ
jgi:hypothetical protein